MAERGIIFKDDFVSVPSKSWFDMSYDNLFSMNFGEIVPSTCMECMAEDVIHAKSSNFTRLAPLVAPAFGKVNQFSYHFYVRNRDIWTHWDSFFTNADQKKSWQSSMSSTFVPPVMPYIDVRKLLFGNNSLFQELAGNSNDLILIDQTYISTNKYRYLFRDFSMDVQYLVLWAENDKQYSFIINASNIINLELDTNAKQYFLIPFIPNKNESRTEDFSTGFRYNPFSNGSLLDYLGVDLTGLYAQNEDFIKDSKYFIEGSSGLNQDFKINFGLPFEPKVVDNRDSQWWISTSIDLLDWLKHHAVLGLIGIYNGQNCASVSSVGRYWMKNSGVDSYGDAPVTKALYFNDESSKISSLPLRAYYFIYSEYFRDENYIDINPVIDFTRDGDEFYGYDVFLNRVNIFDFISLKFKSWEHDPYTTALPGAQRGPAVRFLPDSSVVLSGSSRVTSPANGDARSVAVGYQVGDGAYMSSSSVASDGSSRPALVADLSAATIENFRFANATQRYLEKVARSGNRYYEYMKSIFGADIEDAKLNRPIYLQGDKTPIQVSEVLQTSASQLEDDQPLGQMAGRAVAVGNDDYLEFVTPDNGFFIELCCVLPRVSYQQGLAQMFTRKVQLDYPIPDYAQLGEEQVETGNLYYSADSSIDSIPFGYQSRYWSWKYNRDVVHGEFKDSLDHWTWARKFDSRPIAGKKFLEVDVDYRQFAVTQRNTEHVYTHMFHDIQVQRALPIFGVPSL